MRSRAQVLTWQRASRALAAHSGFAGEEACAAPVRSAGGRRWVCARCSGAVGGDDRAAQGRSCERGVQRKGMPQRLEQRTVNLKRAAVSGGGVWGAHAGSALCDASGMHGGPTSAERACSVCVRCLEAAAWTASGGESEGTRERRTWGRVSRRRTSGAGSWRQRAAAWAQGARRGAGATSEGGLERRELDEGRARHGRGGVTC